MDTNVIRINQEYIESEIRRMLSIFCDELVKKNKDIAELKERLIETDKRRCELAKAYAKKLGVLITKKKFEKKYKCS